MSQDYTEYLAVHVLNEQQYVSYRNLSRALKVHCNLAKQMLYDFHHKQNSKRPGSVNATYLVSGTKRPVQQTNGIHSQNEDQESPMRSSPPMPSSSMPTQEEQLEEKVPIMTLMLVKEEDLVRAKELFENITGIHIYSLQANAVNDIHVLTECNRRVATEYASEDPLKDWKQYGTIQNDNVKRRTGKRPPAPVTVPAADPRAATAKAASAAAAKSSGAEVNSASKPSNKSAAVEQSNSLTTKPAPNKKLESNIFKSFAKGSLKSKKDDSHRGSTVAPLPAAPAVEPEDVPMAGFSDDDDDNESGSGLGDDPKETKASMGKSKNERTAELEAMMDEEDEPMEDAVTPALEAEGHDDSAIENVGSQETAEPKETVTVENGRRRGRRRVMKKKTVKDEEGYLVTREEQAWESFSEDEPAPKKAKIQAPVPNKSTVPKQNAKGGKGNIMSFFSKK